MYWLIHSVLVIQIISIFHLILYIIRLPLNIFVIHLLILNSKILDLLSNIHWNLGLWPYIKVLWWCNLYSLYSRGCLISRKHYLWLSQKNVTSSCIGKSRNLKYFHWNMLCTLWTIFRLSMVNSLNVWLTLDWYLLCRIHCLILPRLLIWMPINEGRLMFWPHCYFFTIIFQKLIAIDNIRCTVEVWTWGCVVCISFASFSATWSVRLVHLLISPLRLCAPMSKVLIV